MSASAKATGGATERSKSKAAETIKENPIPDEHNGLGTERYNDTKSKRNERRKTSRGIKLDKTAPMLQRRHAKQRQPRNVNHLRGMCCLWCVPEKTKRF